MLVLVVTLSGYTEQVLALHHNSKIDQVKQKLFNFFPDRALRTCTLSAFLFDKWYAQFYYGSTATLLNYGVKRERGIWSDHGRDTILIRYRVH